MLQVDALLGSVDRPARWSELRRHLGFGETGDLDDIERLDWPQVRAGLRKGLYGELDPVPVGVEDLASLVAAKPQGPVTSKLNWSNIDDEQFERLIFTLISRTPGYENPEWLMQTRAPDRGRDVSVTRVQQDRLSGSLRQRVVIQCKHWLGKSVNVAEAGAAKDQMLAWSDPVVDILVFATSGRFTADGVAWIESTMRSAARRGSRCGRKAISSCFWRRAPTSSRSSVCASGSRRPGVCRRSRERIHRREHVAGFGGAAHLERDQWHQCRPRARARS